MSKKSKGKKKGYSTGQGARPKDRHIAAVQAEADRYRAMTPVGIRRVFASFPELEDLIDSCAWLVAMVDPTTSRSTGTIGRTSDTDNVGAMLAAGDRVQWYRGHKDFISGELAKLNRQIADKIKPTDHDRYKPPKPRCWRRGCPRYSHHQPYDAEVCQGCGQPFGGGSS